MMFSLDHKQIGKDLLRITEIGPFVRQYEWKDISSSSHTRNWKKFQTNSKSITLNTLLVSHKKRDKTSMHFKIYLKPFKTDDSPNIHKR